ncbi:sulfatase-like hydrolase/transferase [Legionella jordanis]|uniref:Sulfatase n=1 Tax=Legionella jordanis TaxID=456 RepID=A0A0W0VFR6_9GAMM|nr:sulfatase-like hydrolase/transferase [Legionella jordanis]KTD18980.1 Sulfatase [Legionella jordanis]RMX05460.1 hypothetical protein EAW55_02065 [Legionella jordanis]RMX19144.1 hypothetical protein EAS68_06825 [Legionella jordanis]VEH13081.1 Sulfatase [Legionella jordanis]
MGQFKANWRYLFVFPFFLTAILTSFLAANGIESTSHEALTCYLLLTGISFFPGLLLMYGGAFLRISLLSFLVILLILSQFKTLPVLPFSLKYRYLIPVLFATVASLLYVLRNKLDELVFLVFGLLWIGAFFTPKSSFIHVQEFQPERDANSNLPPYVEVVLDEHIGLEGVDPKDAPQLVDQIKNKYINEHFRVFGRAFSRDVRSIASFSNFLNFKPINDLSPYLNDVTEEDKHSVIKNKLFKALSQQGYHINVLQSSYLDVCEPQNHVAFKTCVTYKHIAPTPGNPSTGTITKSVAILKNIFSILHLEIVYNRLKESKVWALLDLPKQDDETLLSPSTAAYKAFPEVLRLAQNIKRGNAYFIHLLLPHAPYVFNKECQYVGEQQNKTQAYFNQVECTHKLLTEFLQVVNNNPETANSTIIFHGDHGSRIEEPDVRRNYQFTQENIIKNFSAFFAVKSPLYSAGYDLTELPLDFLLKKIISGKDIKAEEKTANFVYLRSRNQFDLGKMAMPDFRLGQVAGQPTTTT